MPPGYCSSISGILDSSSPPLPRRSSECSAKHRSPDHLKTASSMRMLSPTISAEGERTLAVTSTALPPPRQRDARDYFTSLVKWLVSPASDVSRVTKTVSVWPARRTAPSRAMNSLTRRWRMCFRSRRSPIITVRRSRLTRLVR